MTTTTELTHLDGRRLLTTVGIAVGVAAVAGLATAWLAPPTWSDATHLGAVISAEVYLAVIVAHLVVFGGRLRWHAPTAPQLVLAFAVWVACWAGAVLVDLAAGTLDELNRAVQLVGSDVGRLSGAAPVLVAVVLVRACLLAPVAEELLFRGSLYGWLRQHVTAAVAIPLTAAAFAAIHQMSGLLAITVALGVGAAWVRERTGSITPFMAMHALTVIVMIVYSYVTVGWQV